jgi:hypothetical protein
VAVSLHQAGFLTYRNKGRIRAGNPDITYSGAAMLDVYAEVLDVLQLTPWNGEPQHEGNPDASVRR